MKTSIERKCFVTGIARTDLIPPLPRGNRQRGPFFWMSKTTFKRVLQNQIQIDYGDENYEYKLMHIYAISAMKNSETRVWGEGAKR